MITPFAFARQARPFPFFTSGLRQYHISRPHAAVRLAFKSSGPRSSNPSRLFSTGRIEVQPVAKQEPTRVWYRVAGMGITLGLSLWVGNIGDKIHCESAPRIEATPPPAAEAPPPLPPPPQSSVNFYELSFGTVCGVCAGVFVKKGAKALAFVFGGVFVLLQYLGSLSLARVDWTRMATRFENLFYRQDAQGVKRPPSLGSAVRWLIDFLTADFQQRASFIAGFALGLRVG